MNVFTYDDKPGSKAGNQDLCLPENTKSKDKNYLYCFFFCLFVLIAE